MLDRSLVLASSLAVSALSAGCLLDAGPYSSGGGGTGASIHTGGLGGSGGVTTSTLSGGAGGMTTSSTGTTSSTTSSTTTTSDPTCPGGCADTNPCTEDVCNNGSCSHPPMPQGTVVPGGDPNDCQQEVCDNSGQITLIDNDNETPLNQATQCAFWVCQNGAATKKPQNDGQPCNEITPGSCKVAKCKLSDCSEVNAPNGSQPDPPNGECAVTTCNNGVPGTPSPDVNLCNLAPQNGGCRVPECGTVANGDFGCYLVDAANNTPCTKQDGSSGNCDNQGNCD